MDILTVLRTIVRRWLVVVPIIIITAAMAFSVGSGIKPEYGMSGTVLLASESGLAPATSDSVAVVTGPVLAEVLRSAAVGKRMADAGAAVPYAVEVDPATSILRVTAAGREGPANIRTVEVVLDSLDEELALLEQTAGVPDRNRASVRLLSRPTGQPGAGVPSASGSAFLVSTGIGRPNQYPANDYTARIVTELMLADESRRKVGDRAGGVANFTLTAQQRDAAPILSISVRGLDPRRTEATFEAVVGTAGDLLDSRQAAAGVDEKSRTRLLPLNIPARATRTSGTVVKSVATVVGLGLIAAATAAILTESFVVGRANNRLGQPDRRRRSRNDVPKDGHTGLGLSNGAGDEAVVSELPNSDVASGRTKRRRGDSGQRQRTGPRSEVDRPTRPGRKARADRRGSRPADEAERAAVLGDNIGYDEVDGRTPEATAAVTPKRPGSESVLEPGTGRNGKAEPNDLDVATSNSSQPDSDAEDRPGRRRRGTRDADNRRSTAAHTISDPGAPLEP